MITTGQLRIFAKEFIGKLTRSDIVNPDDIRWLKSGNGIFPRKLVYADAVNKTGEFKETPYSPDDTFILFDIIQDKNQAAERIGDIVYSQLPFHITVNVYGKGAEDEVQHMIHTLHTYGLRLWLSSKKVALVWEPDEIIPLDGRENASWWIRRRIELKLNTQQEIDYESGLDNGEDIDIITRNIDFNERR
jgi:hypothetical protein